MPPLDPALISSIPDTMTFEQDGKQLPLRDAPFIKEAPDFPTFVKTAYDAHREVGSRIPLKISEDPAKRVTEITQWKKDHLPKFYKSGILTEPPASPEAYGVLKPDKLPEGLVWSDSMAKDFSTILHKHGAPKELASELLQFHEKTVLGIQRAIKSDFDAGIAALKTEFPSDYDTRVEAAKRLAGHIFKTPEELEFYESMGLGNHPGFLAVLMRLAPLAQQDSSFMKDASRDNGGGTLTREEVQREVADIMQNPQNPKHALYNRRDKATMDYIDSLYKKLPGADAKVIIT